VDWTLGENKANSKPNKANLLAFNVLRSADSVKMTKRLFEKTKPMLKWVK